MKWRCLHDRAQLHQAVWRQLMEDGAVPPRQLASHFVPCSWSLCRRKLHSHTPSTNLSLLGRELSKPSPNCTSREFPFQPGTVWELTACSFPVP